MKTQSLFSFSLSVLYCCLHSELFHLTVVLWAEVLNRGHKSQNPNTESHFNQVNEANEPGEQHQVQTSLSPPTVSSWSECITVFRPAELWPDQWALQLSNLLHQLFRLHITANRLVRQLTFRRGMEFEAWLDLWPSVGQVGRELAGENFLWLLVGYKSL